MTPGDRQIGKRVAKIREHRKLSQSELAEAIGASRSVMNHIENGHSRLKYEQAWRLADALQCAMDDLAKPPDAPIPRIRIKH